jgi:uncharacterized protein CbrC (UPF0167 family)
VLQPRRQQSSANKFNKSFQSETKQIKNTVTQNLKEKWEEKRMH